MTEAAYLKEDLGPVLAKGLAAVSVARPHDPVEYLALWMLHHIQQRERKQQEVEKAKELEGQREEWAKGRSQREKQATAVIQREWKAHVRSKEESKMKEAELREIFMRLEEVAEEKFPEETIDATDKGESERNAEQERVNAQTQFNKTKLYIAELNKHYIADFKQVNSNNKSALLTLRCVFYAMGCRPKQVESWEKIRSLIKPYPFAEWINKYDPCNQSGTGTLEKRRPITRVRRLLTLVNEEEVRTESIGLHAVYQWLHAAVNFRHNRDEHIKAKRAAGKETEEELDEEEEAEDEEKDADEEVIKAEEAEAARIAEAERAEDGDGDADPDAADE